MLRQLPLSIVVVTALNFLLALSALAVAVTTTTSPGEMVVRDIRVNDSYTFTTNFIGANDAIRSVVRECTVTHVQESEHTVAE